MVKIQRIIILIINLFPQIQQVASMKQTNKDFQQYAMFHPTLSDLSISEIKQKNFSFACGDNEKKEANNDPSPYNQKEQPCDQYGIGSYCPSGINRKLRDISIGHEIAVNENNWCLRFFGQPKNQGITSISFSKDRSRKKKTLNSEEKNIQSAGSKKSKKLSELRSHGYEMAPAKKIQIVFHKVSTITSNANEKPFFNFYQENNQQKSYNPYYLTPQQLKCQINDYNLQFNYSVSEKDKDSRSMSSQKTGTMKFSNKKSLEGYSFTSDNTNDTALSRNSSQGRVKLTERSSIQNYMGFH